MSWNNLVAIPQDTINFINNTINFINNTINFIEKHAIIILGLTWWIKFLADKKLDNYKSSNQSDLEKSKSDLALNLDISKRYSLEQFKLYNELWISLYNSKVGGDDLWEVANIKNVKAFAQQLKKTENQIDRHSLLIEDQHYLNLKNLINDFYQFKFGKITLYELRNNNSNNYDSQLQVDQIKEVIDRNKEIKDKYSSLLVYLKEDFKRQIRGI